MRDKQMKTLILLPATILLSGCLAASVAGATVGVLGKSVELAGKTVYYTGKGAVSLASGGKDSVPVTLADNIDNVEKGQLRLTVNTKSHGEVYSTQKVIPARALDNELKALTRRGDVVGVYVDRP